MNEVTPIQPPRGSSMDSKLSMHGNVFTTSPDRSYVRNCKITMRDGDECLFKYDDKGQLCVFLDGYRIEPLTAAELADLRAAAELLFAAVPSASDSQESGSTECKESSPLSPASQGIDHE